jgi:hypothetical protein
MDSPGVQQNWVCIFFEFSTIFYGFSKIQQNWVHYLRFTITDRTMEVLILHKNTLSSHKTYRKDSGPCNVALGHGGRLLRPKFRWPAGVPGWGSVGIGRGAHQGSICVPGWGRGAVGDGTWRTGAPTVARAPAPASSLPGQGNWRLGRLQ